MRTLLFFSLLLITARSFAGDDPFLRLQVNQRNFLNPGTVCPFCKGSCYAAFGMRHAEGSWPVTGNAMYFSIGNDARNQIHGPWDFSYMHSADDNSKTDGYSARYAYAFNIGDWRMGVGARASYYRFEEKVGYGIEGPPAPFIDPITFRGSQFDFDLGTMVTDLHGTYFGASVRHLAEPAVTMKNKVKDLLLTKELGRTFSVMAGSKFDLSDNWDLLPEATFQHNGVYGMIEGGAMLRYDHQWAAGVSVLSGGEAPHLAFHAGFTRQKFKWIAEVEPSAKGVAIETGIVWRFFFQQECDGIPPKPLVKTEFTPHGE